MTRPRFSVVIPTREGRETLTAAIQTCVVQEFDDYEVVVADNWSSPATREVVASFPSPTVRYVRSPRLLAMTDSWEFAVGQAAGEYVTVIGDDDGLLPHALREIDGLLRKLDEPLVLRWEPARYHWPDLPSQPHMAPDELLIPLKQVPEGFHPIHVREARPMMLAGAHSEVTYAQLPMIYCSVVQQKLLTQLRQRAGRIFRSPWPDVYSGFALGYLVGWYHAVEAPMSINALSGKSNGVATLSLKGRSPIAHEFHSLNAKAAHMRHAGIPDLPLMAVVAADAFEHAREALFPDDPVLRLDRRQVIRSCIYEARPGNEAAWEALRTALRAALMDDPELPGWFDQEYGTRSLESLRPLLERPAPRRYGGTYVRLDGAAFGVKDVFGAAELCERILGYKADGVNYQLMVSRPRPSRWRRIARDVRGWFVG